MTDGENQEILVPGQWTHPTVAGDTVIQQTVYPQIGEEVEDVNFGWDYQFD